jgi:hypothetical protein
MTAAPLISISSAVEGTVDEAVARRLISSAGAAPGPVYGKTGKPQLRRQIRGYGNAARFAPWLVLVDLDDESECAPPLVREWLPLSAPLLCFRVAVRAIEAWLMADRESLAAFLGVARSRIPNSPEEVADPKRAIVNLARSSRRRAIREDMVPRLGSGRSVGPAYTSRLTDYVESHWRPETAAQRAESLARAIACLQRLVDNLGPV